jgi:hypothetical protein
MSVFRLRGLIRSLIVAVYGFACLSRVLVQWVGVGIELGETE